MPGQLDFECPVCHRECKIPTTFQRVYCICGAKVYRNGKIDAARAALHLPQEILEARLGVCRECDSYTGHRCTLLNKGCRRDYMHQLYKEHGQCPLGLWQPQ
jgi:hypothetical protein